MPHYDLHCHSTRSDGLLSPADVVRRAAGARRRRHRADGPRRIGGTGRGARSRARRPASRSLTASELSVTWHGETVHVVALGIDPDNADARRGPRRGVAAVATRARGGSATRSQDAGIPDAFEGALAFVTSERLISRTHFARYLIEAGHVRDMKDAFKRYLTAGKPGYVPHAWATLPEALGWIHGAGGRR